MSIKEEVCDFNNLYNAMMICKRGIMWKDSTAGFVANGLVNCLDLKDDLLGGTYKISKYTIFTFYERKKLRRLVNKAERGEISRQKVDECYKSWKAHASKGNSYNLIKSMDRYYNSLWKENVNEAHNS